MPDRKLQIFCTLAETLNFSRTAERCGISQPAVTKAISSLEKELGKALFVRYGRDIAITSTGESLLPIARRILAEYSGIENLK